jgi:hypothetical protein
MGFASDYSPDTGLDEIRWFFLRAIVHRLVQCDNILFRDLRQPAGFHAAKLTVAASGSIGGDIRSS